MTVKKRHLQWTERAVAARGPKPALTLERIARAAIEIADTEGLPAVSMQRVAKAFDFTTMALYRYVPGKDELVELMFDTAMDLPPKTNVRGWRPAVEKWARAVYAFFVDHPWALEVVGRLRPVGPNELAWMESAAVALSQSGLDGPAILDAMLLVSGHVRIIAQVSGSAAASAEGWSKSVESLVGAHADRFPALVATGGFGSSDALVFGLDCILDGIQAQARKPKRRKTRQP